MVKAEYNAELWEKRLMEKTKEYHNSLIDLLQKKMSAKDNDELSFNDYDEVMQTFASCVSIQRTIVDLSMNEAKIALTNGFTIKDGIATENK